MSDEIRPAGFGEVKGKSRPPAPVADHPAPVDRAGGTAGERAFGNHAHTLPALLREGYTPSVAARIQDENRGGRVKCPNCEAPIPAPPRSGISGKESEKRGSEDHGSEDRASENRGSSEAITACPQCGFPIPPEDVPEPTLVGFGPKRSRGDTTVRPGAAAPDTASGKAPDPVLGFIVTYSETAPGEDGQDSRFGRIYPMRVGQVLFVGKAPAPAQVRRADGAMIAPVASHLFPRSFGYISKHHLTVEMEPDGPTILTDTSSNGLYFMKTQQYVRRSPGDSTPQVHRVVGDETLVLALNLPELRDDPEALAQSERVQLRILRPTRSAAPHAREEGR
jgi:hypothetical protein